MAAPTWQDFYAQLKQRANSETTAKLGGGPDYKAASLDYVIKGSGISDSPLAASVSKSPLGTAKDASVSAVSWIIDKLSRPAYAMGSGLDNALTNFDKTEGKGLVDRAMSLVDPLNGGGNTAAAWKGFTGENKTMVSDALDKHKDTRAIKAAVTTTLPLLSEVGLGVPGIPTGEAGQKVSKFAVDLTLDAATDPTSYIGPGAVKAGLKAGSNFLAKGVYDGAKTVEKAVEKTAPVVNLSVNDAAKMADIGNLAPVKEMFPNARQATKAIPEEGSRVFNVGSDGAAASTKAPLQIEGPKGPVTKLRADAASVEKLVPDVQTSKYANASAIPDSGFFVEKAAPKTSIEAAANSGKELTQLIGDSLVNKANKIQVPVGTSGLSKSLRELMVDAASTNPQAVASGRVARASQNIAKFVASEAANAAKSGDPVRYMKEVHGADLAMPIKKAETAVVKDTQAMVKTYDKMPIADKIVWLDKYGKGIAREDMAYLARASNYASFKTRLAKLRSATVSHSSAADLLAHLGNGGKLVEGPATDAFLQALGATPETAAAKLGHLLGEKKAAEEALNFVAKDAVTVGTKEVARAIPKPRPSTFNATKVEAAITRAKKGVASITPANVITEAAMTAGKLPAAVTPLSVNSSKVLDMALRAAVDMEVIKPSDKALYAFVTNRGVLRTAAELNMGVGRIKGVWNKFSQYSFHKALMANSTKVDGAVKKVLDDAGAALAGSRQGTRASVMYDTFMPMYKAMDEILRTGGVFSTIGLRNGSDHLLSFSEILHALPDDLVKRAVFTMDKVKGDTYISHFAPTQLMDAVSAGLDLLTVNPNATSAEMLSVLSDVMTKVQKTRGGKEVPNGFARAANAASNKSEYIANKLLPIVDALPELAQTEAKNIAARELYTQSRNTEIITDTLDEFAKFVNDPAHTSSDLLAAAATLPEVTIRPALRAKGLTVDEWSTFPDAVKALDEGLAQLGATKQVIETAKIAEEMAKANNKASIAVKGLKQVTGYSDNLVDELRAAGHEISDEVKDAGGIFQTLARAFFPHIGNETLRPLYMSKELSGVTLSRQLESAFNRVSRNHSAANIDEAFRGLKIGLKPTNPQIVKAQNDLRQVIDMLFATDPKFSIFSRRGITPSEMNHMFKRFGIHESFEFTDPKRMHDAWKDWETNDIMDLMSRVTAATSAVVTRKAVGASFSKEFGRVFGGDGYVKLTGNAMVLQSMDRSLYYPKEIANELNILNQAMIQMDKPLTTSRFLKIFDTLQATWKSHVTIYRPGHHIRNEISDIWLNWMAGVTSPAYYKKAAEILAQNKGRYDGLDSLKARLHGDEVIPTGPPNRMKSSSSPMIHVPVNGKRVPLSSEDVYQAAFKYGVNLDYHVIEDVNGATANIFYNKLYSKMEEKGLAKGGFFKSGPVGGKAHKVAAGVSEMREHHIRLTQFMHELENAKNFKSMDEAYQFAAARVRKWHPDGSDLTRFERRTMRRIIPFYSWSRKIIPLVLESMLMNPGKVNTVPKAMYDLAKANGIQPASMSDPFPTDQMFPDFMTDKGQGPIAQIDGHYWGISPGIPFNDTVGDYGTPGSAKDTILSSLTPALKIPIETTIATAGAKGDPTAVNLRTKRPVYDTTDYIDQQIPYFVYLAGITGKSPSSLFTQNKNNKEENTGGDASRVIFNILSGLGAQDMSKYNAKK